MRYDDGIYTQISDYIFKHTGIHYAEANFYQLDARISKLMKFLETEDENVVSKALKGIVSADVHQMIVDLATNNETYFFRDPVVFTQVRKHIVPLIKERLAAGHEFTVWSAASSSGQEIYSVIMAINEEAPGLLDGKLKFFASDISSQILQKAQKATYTQLEVQRGLPIMLMSKYFKPDGDKSWQFSPDLAAKVEFKAFNLLKDRYPENKYDLVLCRNVLIYQKKENKAKILENIYGALKPSGHLILGNTENTYNLTESFEPAKLENVNFYRKEDPNEKKEAA